MSKHWSALTPREKLMVAGASIMIGLYVFLQLLVAPIVAWRDQAVQQAAASRSDYRLVSQAAAVSNRGSASDVPVRLALNAAAESLNYKLSFVNALPNGAVEMQAAAVSPEATFKLFAALQSEHGVNVTTADITRTPGDPNSVRVQATLAR